ncbi:DNA/RNA helicase domain-containing protein [Croceitalea marina]|uniref:DNA/RNA helicase domain-containing protein n=1 Tax=Croceitalea marina TaxID=1775166 RepID=A0ABW5N1Y5_9FLAO
MIQTNLLSLIQAYQNLARPLFEEYLKYHSVSIKSDELDDMSLMVNELCLIYGDVDIYDGFVVGFSIPQIGKEFDLLRFGKTKVVNIEVKKIGTPEKIKKQLLRNRYYLDFLGKEISQTTFISDERKFYVLDEHNNVIELTNNDVVELLLNQDPEHVEDVNELFNPANYLVSPFNSSHKFLNEEYFLTQQQELIKKSALADLSSEKEAFVSIKGEAGTGKTLLIYDIAKDYIKESRRVVVVHCANLNSGQHLLNDEVGWNIVPAKITWSINFSDYDIVIVDEAQRMYPNQLDYVITEVKKNLGKCIFSYDMEQCLRTWEINNKNHLQIKKSTESKIYELTKTIRTNKEISFFIKALLNQNTSVPKIQGGNVILKYFKEYDHAKFHIEHLCSQGWIMINYTPDKKEKYKYEKFSQGLSDNAHGVIGQEFEKVIAVVDYHFQYIDNKLSLRGYARAPFYHPIKMLSQIMTRTRGKLYLIIINNDEVMARALKLLNG